MQTKQSRVRPKFVQASRLKLRLCSAFAAIFLGLATSSGVHADQLVFGSFENRDNALNWAKKISLTFGLETIVQSSQLPPSQTQESQRAAPQHGVEQASEAQTDSSQSIEPTQLPLRYRVITKALGEAQVEQIKRRADVAGISVWRLRTQESVGLQERAVTKGGAQAQIAEKKIEQSTPHEIQTTQKASPRLGGARLVAPGGQSLSQQDQFAQTQGRTIAKSGDTNKGGRIDENPGVWEWEMGLQTRSFFADGNFGQKRHEVSGSLEFDYYKDFSAGKYSLTINPFLRVDSVDPERSHSDIRQLFISRVGDDWDFHLGAKRVFWGVTEFNHLVDIINQTDLIENIDGEDKLGQPLAQLTLVRDWGILDIYALFGFRERTFPGVEGRLRLPLEVTDRVRYESGAEQYRTDAAIRWSHNLGPFEVGLHHFSGTSREPIFQPRLAPGGRLVLEPFYPVIEQSGIDAQAFFGDWAVKFEGFSRSGFDERYAAFNVGFERTLVGILGSRVDLGIVGEYMFDERGDDAFNTLFENDIVIGGRLQFNDFADSQALLGYVFDADSAEYFLSLEASSRLSASWLLSIEGRAFGGGRDIDENTPAALLLRPDFKSAWLQADDFVQLELKKFF